MTEYFCQSTEYKGHTVKIVHKGPRPKDPYRAYIDGRIAVERARTVRIADELARAMVDLGLIPDGEESMP